jgi:hypothetical protein
MGVPEADADLIAWLMASTVGGALLALLATGDKGTATRTVEAAADFVEELVARARQRPGAEVLGRVRDGADP